MFRNVSNYERSELIVMIQIDDESNITDGELFMGFEVKYFLLNNYIHVISFFIYAMSFVTSLKICIQWLVCSCLLHTFLNVRNFAPMTHLPLLPSPLGRSSSRPCINPPESSRGHFTRQPQSLQDHQDSCHSSVRRRASGAWARGLCTNTVMSTEKQHLWAWVLIIALTPLAIHITGLVRILICSLMYPRIPSMRKRMIHLWWADSSAKRCVEGFLLKQKISFIFTPTVGLKIKSRLKISVIVCKGKWILLRFESFRGASWTVRQNTFKWVNKDEDDRFWIGF